MLRLSRALSGVVLIALLAPSLSMAQPSEIILLRHAEKADAYALCDIGRRRADALARQYLGKGAAQSLFAPGEAPAAFLAVTLHPLETVTPAAQTWGLPVIVYSVLPEKNQDEDSGGKDEDINRRTREAARDLMTKPEYDGKIVVIAWEHKRIASRKLEKEYKGEEVTFRQMLGLSALPDVPETWPGTNYDYFWIVQYARGNPSPTGFRMVKQAFAEPYGDLPAPDWGADEPLHVQAGCKP